MAAAVAFSHVAFSGIYESLEIDLILRDACSVFNVLNVCTQNQNVFTFVSKNTRA